MRKVGKDPRLNVARENCFKQLCAIGNDMATWFAVDAAEVFGISEGRVDFTCLPDTV